MPKTIPWCVLGEGVAPAEAATELAKLRSFDITKSNKIACSICSGELHLMRYRLLVCSSEACCEGSELQCAWRGKLLTCLETDLVSIYECGQHTSAGPLNEQRFILTDVLKAYCREMAEQHLRPMRIRSGMSRKFNIPLKDVPLKVVQNFVYSYARSKLDNHDLVDELRKWIHARAFSGCEEVTQPFTFGWHLDSNGKPVVGNGSKENPFVLGLTTKTMISRLLLPPDSFILHIDATYKMNYCEYPVVVVGISDRSRAFHLVALFVVSQEIQPIFEAVLLSLKRLFFWVTGQPLRVRYAMADGDQAQYNALNAVFGDFPGFQLLMCFFHVMEKVQKAIKGLPSVTASGLLRDIYDLHFARSEMEFFQLREQVLAKWMSVSSLERFWQYMSGQWLYGRFSSWQGYLTPSGFATTNNPAETFNALLKRDYTLRRRLKMGTLLKELSDCCEDRSSTPRIFHWNIEPSNSLARRVSDMIREKLLYTGVVPNTDSACTEERSIVPVVSLLAKRVVVAPNKRTEEGIAVCAQMGSNYARMEVEGQPWCGWQVDIASKWCGCNYCFVFGTCVHVLFALRVTEHVDNSGRSVLVNRKKRRRAGVNQTIGRPRAIGPALSFD